MMGREGRSHRYDDILFREHHVSASRPHMSLRDRAAQFAPFAALKGHDQAIRETARLTSRKVELDEDRRMALDERFQYLQKHIQEHPQISVTYFVEDANKEGGSYEVIHGRLRKILLYEKEFLMEDGSVIPIPEIVEIQEIK